ncbi:unnamed protein product, partial [Prorocentrum cordatum]
MSFARARLFACPPLCLAQIFQQTQREFARVVDARFAAAGGRLGAMGEEMRNFGRLRQEMDELRAEMGAAAAPLAAPPQQETGWSRPVDDAILSVVARAKVPEQAVSQALGPPLVDAELRNLPGAATELEGEDMGRHCTLRCVGAAGLAARRTGKLLGLCVGRERNQCQISHEIFLKRINDAPREVIAEKLFVNKEAFVPA